MYFDREAYDYELTDYTQCLLERSTDEGKKIYTTWIPAKFAVVGKTLGLRRVVEEGNGCCIALVEGEWEEGWVVKECYDTKGWRELKLLQEQRLR